MPMTDTSASKRPKISENDQDEDVKQKLSKRKQVDAHVRAFLQAILENTQLEPTSNSRSGCKRHRRDASTQTDFEYEDAEWEENMCDQNYDLTSNHDYYNQGGCTYSLDDAPVIATSELSGTNYLQSFYTSTISNLKNSDASHAINQTHLDPHSDILKKSNRISSTKVKKVMKKWVRQYEEWFFENFGVDVRGSLNKADDNLQLPLASFPEAFQAVDSISNNQLLATNCTNGFTVSHPPVMYSLPQHQVQIPDFSQLVNLHAIPIIQSSDANQGLAPELYQFVQQRAQGLPIAQTCPFASSLLPNLSTLYSSNPLLLTDPTFQSSGLDLNLPSPSIAINNMNFALSPQLVNSFQMLSTPNNLDLPAHDSSVDANAASFSSAQSIISQNPLSSLSPDSGKLNDTQMSVLLTALAFPISLGGRYSWMGPWGPLLRYGTYGRLPENQVLPNRTRISRTFVKKLIARARASEKKSVDQSGLDCDTQYSEVTRSGSSIADDNDDDNFSLSEWLPPPPPPLILMRKQSMICSLQLAVRDRFHDLLIREADKQRSLNINYVEELSMFIEKTVRINAVYLFTQLHRLPKEEQAYYLDGLALKATHSEPTVQNGNDSVPIERPYSILNVENTPESMSTLQKTKEMYACDLMIGDVLISQGLADYKKLAQTCSARQAVHILADQCFLVGSVRRWQETDFLVVCLSPLAELVPCLPPFLSDPREPFVRKDRSINESDAIEAFQVVNPKPIDELWLYTALPVDNDCWENLPVEQLLAQSAEFSQMNISFEIEVDTRTGEFLCYCLVDGQRCCDLITYHTGPPTSCSSVATVWPSFTRKSIGSDCFSQVTSSDNQSASSEPNKPFKADYGIIGVGCAVSKTAPLARELAARSLVDWCREKQPIVGLTPSCSISSKDSELTLNSSSVLQLWGLSEELMVETLMWGKSERKFAIPLEQLEAYCEVPPMPELTISAYTGVTVGTSTSVTQPQLSVSSSNVSASSALEGSSKADALCNFSQSAPGASPSRDSRRASGNAIDFHEAEALSTDEELQQVIRQLEHFLPAYAASALVTPLCLRHPTILRAAWPAARRIAQQWGLLTKEETEVCHAGSSFESDTDLSTSLLVSHDSPNAGISRIMSTPMTYLLVCKRAPLPRVKRTLLERGRVGALSLLSRGVLSTASLNRLTNADLLDEDDGNDIDRAEDQSVFSSTSREDILTETLDCGAEASIDRHCSSFNSISHASEGQSLHSPPDDSVTRLARRFRRSGGRVAVKHENKESEAFQPPEDCVLVSAEFNQPSTAVEILDDLPRQLIPGIDF